MLHRTSAAVLKRKSFFPYSGCFDLKESRHSIDGFWLFLFGFYVICTKITVQRTRLCGKMRTERLSARPTQIPTAAGESAACRARGRREVHESQHRQVFEGAGLSADRRPDQVADHQRRAAPRERAAERARARADLGCAPQHRGQGLQRAQERRVDRVAPGRGLHRGRGKRRK